MATLAGRLRLPSSLYSTSSKFLAFSPATSASASIGLRSFAAKAAGGEPAPASPSSSSSSSSAAPPQDSKKDKAQQGDTDEQASWLADWQVSQSVLDERDANKAKLTSNYEDRKKTAVSLGGPLDRKLYVAGLRNKDGTKREARLIWLDSEGHQQMSMSKKDFESIKARMKELDAEFVKYQKKLD
mmetsp:Transcript_11283/g.24868  ORF Transcript_11283/g.24868 Transcript_11283/m.24868 type:complete len:185 (-) Transcript_11283:66-620(-)